MDYGSLIPAQSKGKKKKKKKAVKQELDFFKIEDSNVKEESEYSKDGFTMIGAEPEKDAEKLPPINKNKDNFGRSKGVIHADSLFD